MKTYKIVFTSESVINSIPNSQTLFGAICTILLQTQGQNEFDEYIKSLKEGYPKFVHSSMFLDGYLPMVKKNLFSAEIINGLVGNSDYKDKLTILGNTKKYKKISNMSYGIYEEYIEKDKFEQLQKDIRNNKNKFVIEEGMLRMKDESSAVTRGSSQLTRNGPPIDDTNDRTLFYTQALYYPKGTKFCIYVKSDETKEYLTKIFKHFEYFGIGNRRTVGNNCFKLETIEEVHFNENESQKLILSRYIPNDDEVDFDQSSYQLTSDIYRSSKTYGDGAINGRYVHVLEGSLIKVKINKEFYGRIIEAQSNDKTIYHYGIGFSV